MEVYLRLYGQEQVPQIKKLLKGNTTKSKRDSSGSKGIVLNVCKQLGTSHLDLANFLSINLPPRQKSKDEKTSTNWSECGVLF